MKIGDRVSHYEIIEVLGAGGMGVVYQAPDARLKRTFALKFLSWSRVEDAEAKQRFLTCPRGPSDPAIHGHCVSQMRRLYARVASSDFSNGRPRAGGVRLRAARSSGRCAVARSSDPEYPPHTRRKAEPLGAGSTRHGRPSSTVRYLDGTIG